MPNPLRSISRVSRRISRNPILLFFALVTSYIASQLVEKVVGDQSTTEWLAERGWPNLMVLMGTVIAIFIGILIVAGIIIWLRGKSDLDGTIIAAWQEDCQITPSRMYHYVTLKMLVKNPGDDIAVKDYRFEYITDSWTRDGDREDLTDQELIKPFGIRERLEDLYSQKREPIPHNGYVEGYLRYRVPGRVPHPLQAPVSAKIKLTIEDISNETCTIKSDLTSLLRKGKAEGELTPGPFRYF